LRLADIELTDIDGAGCGTDMLGLTMAADGLTKVVGNACGYCGWVYGGRLSLLGGDWGGDDNSLFIDSRVRDDNMVVTELYVGLEGARQFRGFMLSGRAGFEIQNWRSDVLASDDIQSIGFLGPGLQIGVDF
jgi:hypothetical protein